MSTHFANSVLRSRLVSAIEVEQVPWLWSGWIARRALSVLDGDPGLGKSTLSFWLAARVSRGLPLPGEAKNTQRAPAGVLIASAEDSAAHTIRPRLEAAGADLDRIRIIDDVGEPDESGETTRNLQLPADLPLIEEQMKRDGASLLIVDPLMAYVGRDRQGRLIDPNRELSARKLLNDLKRLSESTESAVLVVRHLTKSGRASAVHRGTGSIGITGAARSVLLAGMHPEDADSRVLAMVKTNLAPRPKSWTYQFRTTENIATIAWGGACDLFADDLLSLRNKGNSEELGPVEKWLWDVLSQGPKEANKIYQMGRNAGISPRRVWTAAKTIRVSKWKSGFQGSWIWQLPTEPDMTEMPPLE